MSSLSIALVVVSYLVVGVITYAIRKFNIELSVVGGCVYVVGLFGVLYSLIVLARYLVGV